MTSEARLLPAMYELYKVIHLFAVALMFAALGGLAVLALRGGTADEVTPIRKLLSRTHGLALLLLIVTGFGALMRLGMSHGSGMPSWVYGKITVWLLLGAALVPLKRAPGLAKLLLFVLPLFGGLAAWIAITKPG